MSADLFSAARSRAAAPRSTAPLVDISRPTAVAFVTDAPGCHGCPAWTRIGTAVGRCVGDGSPHRGSLTSYAALCRAHPQHPSPSEGESR